MKRWLILFALFVCGLPAAAQHRATPLALDALRPEARAHVELADTLLRFRTRAVPGGRLDVDEGVLRAAYRIGLRVAPAASPEAAARAYLAAAAPGFGLTPETLDLAVASVVRGRYSTHVVFQQTFFGLPVYNRQVKVSLNRDGQPTMALSGYAPHLAGLRSFDTRPALSADAATARAQALVSAAGARTTTPELVVYPAGQPRLAWRLLAWPQDAPAEWEVLLDAHTGEIIRLFDQSTHAHGERRRKDETTRRRDDETTRRQAIRNPRSAIRNPQFRVVDGTGLVFDPDPLTTAGLDYGGAYVDANDADIEALNAERREVVLRDITQGTDGLYRLEGPYAFIDGSAGIGGNTAPTPAEADPNGFRYGRADDLFEAVMSYYHVDTSQRYVQSLDLGYDIQAVPVRINPHGLGNNDDSRYFTGQNAIAFGDGGIDDAEDADVIWHEYAHALLQGNAPGLLTTSEGQALHEGWADYWAASYSRGLIDAGLVPDRDWRKVFTWDGNETWNGRRLDRAGTYPGGITGNKYSDGLLWATTLMEIYDEVGRAVIDRLNLASHGFLSVPTTFADAAEALIQADIDYFDGAHLGVLLQRLGDRGYVDPTAFGPVLAHVPIPYAEQAGSTVAIEVDVTSASAPLDRVLFFYSINGGPFEELLLAAQGGDRYGGSLTLPPEATEVAYYLEALDQAGQRTRLPAAAPQETFRFGVGPDAEPPRITHEPIRQASIQAWPVAVIAEVADNQAVDSVWVTFLVEAPGGTVRAEGAFGLLRQQGRYAGVFPVSADLLEEGSLVRYRLHARDVAAQPNEAVLPESGTLAFEIVARGVLAAFNAEADEGLLATGVWARGVPVYGLQTAHSGQSVWATNLAAAYPEAEQRSTLDLPPFNLGALERAYLVFWHWYDFEHSGVVFPDQATTESFWDGGNLKVSTDDGTSWTVLVPEGGYNGQLESGTGNPLEGEPGFGGYSFGWRRVVAVLPTAENVRLRFDFGSDGTNELASISYAGWYLDDLRLTTELPVDTTPPRLLAGPPAVVTSDAGREPPPIVVQADDDTGLAAVQAVYEIIEAAGARSQGTLRLAMSTTDLTTFSAAFALPRAPGVGDRIEYRLSLHDFDGNATFFPAPGSPPLRIEHRLTESVGALGGVRASGLWQRQGQGWRAATAGSTAEDRSSLVLQPLDLPANADEIAFTLTHQWLLGEGLGGNLKLSLDGGETWSVLAPQGGYGATFSAAHPMRGEPIFGGQTGQARQAVFDLTAHAGRQVRLRIDLGTTRALDAGEFWNVEQAVLAYGTLEGDFEIPRTLALHPNFPDPFLDNTTLSYTLPEAMPVRLEVYNILGQRVALLVDAEQPAGTYTLTMSRGSLAGGVYLLRLMAGTTQKVEQMVIAR